MTTVENTSGSCGSPEWTKSCSPASVRGQRPGPERQNPFDQVAAEAQAGFGTCAPARRARWRRTDCAQLFSAVITTSPEQIRLCFHIFGRISGSSKSGCVPTTGAGRPEWPTAGVVATRSARRAAWRWALVFNTGCYRRRRRIPPGRREVLRHRLLFSTIWPSPRPPTTIRWHRGAARRPSRRQADRRLGQVRPAPTPVRAPPRSAVSPSRGRGAPAYPYDHSRRRRCSTRLQLPHPPSSRHPAGRDGTTVALLRSRARAISACGHRVADPLVQRQLGDWPARRASRGPREGAGRGRRHRRGQHLRGRRRARRRSGFLAQLKAARSRCTWTTSRPERPPGCYGLSGASASAGPGLDRHWRNVAPSPCTAVGLKARAISRHLLRGTPSTHTSLTDDFSALTVIE